VQLYVPITFMISPAGQTAQPTRFLMNQVVVKTADGWKVSSILPTRHRSHSNGRCSPNAPFARLEMLTAERP
jgi:hypothetical protein